MSNPPLPPSNHQAKSVAHMRICRWFHVKVCMVAGVGFFTDAYDIFAINIASTMLGYVYNGAHSGSLAPNADLGVKVATPVGTLVGQLLFGWLADRVGRKRMCKLSCVG